MNRDKRFAFTGRQAPQKITTDALRYDLLTILLADDNQHMRMIVTEILRAIGVRRIYEAGDGAQGLQVLRTHPVDIVMTDLSMTPLDGIDFVRLIRKSTDSATQLVPVIMITGHSTLTRVNEARDAGVNEFLTKPITGRGLIERISLVVNQPRPFVRSATYFGPDRRRHADARWQGPMRRAGDDRPQQRVASHEI